MDDRIRKEIDIVVTTAIMAVGQLMSVVGAVHLMELMKRGDERPELSFMAITVLAMGMATIAISVKTRRKV